MACRLIILSLCTILMPWLSSCHQSKGSESDGAGAMSCGPGEMYLHTRQVCTKIEVLETTDHPECLGDKKFLVRYDQKTACMDLNFKPHLEDCLTDGVDHSSCVYFTKLCDTATCKKSQIADADHNDWRVACSKIGSLQCGDDEYPDIGLGLQQHEVFSIHRPSFTGHSNEQLNLSIFSSFRDALSSVGHTITSTVTHITSEAWEGIKDGTHAIEYGAQAVAAAAESGGAFVAKEGQVVSNGMVKGVLFVGAEATKAWGIIEANACKIVTGALLTTAVAALTSSSAPTMDALVTTLAKSLAKNSTTTVVKTELKPHVDDIAKPIALSMGIVVSRTSGDSAVGNMVEQLVFTIIEKALIEAVMSALKGEDFSPSTVVQKVIISELTLAICYGVEKIQSRYGLTGQELMNSSGVTSRVDRLPSPNHGLDTFRIFMNHQTPPHRSMDLEGELATTPLFTEDCHNRHKDLITERVILDLGLSPDKLVGRDIDFLANSFAKVTDHGNFQTIMCNAINNAADEIKNDGVCATSLAGETLTQYLANRKAVLLAGANCEGSVVCPDGSCETRPQEEIDCNNKRGLMFNGVCYNSDVKFSLKAAIAYGEGQVLAQYQGWLYMKQQDYDNTLWLMDADPGRCQQGSGFLVSWYKNSKVWYDGYAAELPASASHTDYITMGAIWSEGFTCFEMVPCDTDHTLVKLKAYHHPDVSRPEIAKNTGYYLARTDILTSPFLDDDERRACFAIERR